MTSHTLVKYDARRGKSSETQQHMATRRRRQTENIHGTDLQLSASASADGVDAARAIAGPVSPLTVVEVVVVAYTHELGVYKNCRGAHNINTLTDFQQSNSSSNPKLRHANL